MRLMRLGAAVVLAAGVTAIAQPPSGGRMGGGPANLVGSKTVQEAIKASEEQVGKLKTWGQEYTRKQFEGMKERFAELKELDEADRGKKMAEIQAGASKKAYAELADVLKPEQVARLKQVEVQVAGAAAFSRPEVQTALKLTDEQKDKLKDAATAYGREVRELREEMGLGGFGGGKGGGRPDPAKQQEFQKKQGAMTKELMTKVDGMLTADQKKAWKELTGDTIDTAKVQAEMQASMMAGMRKKKDD